LPADADYCRFEPVSASRTRVDRQSRCSSWAGVGSSAIGTTALTPRAACWWPSPRWPSKHIGASTATSLRLAERRSRCRDSRSAGRATGCHFACCRFRRVKQGPHEPLPECSLRP